MTCLKFTSGVLFFRCPTYGNGRFMTTSSAGFTLFEVLLTLCLMSGTALGLLTQQYQATHILYISRHDIHLSQAADNHREKSL